MQNKEPNLRLPGPVALPRAVREIMKTQMINHRGRDYADILDRMTANLQTILMTKNDAYFITSSGTGAMETAIVNTLSPGESVLALSIGWFGQRFADIADAYGMDVERLEFPQGEPVDAERLRQALRKNPSIRSVLVTHNESSTGVSNPLEQLCKVIHEESDALILVDAVSSAGGVQIAIDAWGIDVVATAAQKSWVAPPGIAMVTFSKKAWQAYGSAKCPRYYYDIGQYRDYLKKGQPPFTPCLTTMFALENALDNIVAEGIEEVFHRHAETARLVRSSLASLGLKILPKPEFASNTVTAVRMPEGLDGKRFLEIAENKYDVIFGGGQQSLTGKIFRFGHMGKIPKEEIGEALEVVGFVIKEMEAEAKAGRK